jgi:hypothetical protein
MVRGRLAGCHGRQLHNDGRRRAIVDLIRLICWHCSRRGNHALFLQLPPFSCVQPRGRPGQIREVSMGGKWGWSWLQSNLHVFDAANNGWILARCLHPHVPRAQQREALLLQQCPHAPLITASKFKNLTLCRWGRAVGQICMGCSARRGRTEAHHCGRHRRQMSAGQASNRIGVNSATVTCHVTCHTWHALHITAMHSVRGIT